MHYRKTGKPDGTAAENKAALRDLVSAGTHYAGIDGIASIAVKRATWEGHDGDAYDPRA